MTVCKFFLQGNCRYGENCRFEHQINRDHNYGNNTTSVLRQQSTGSTDINTLIRSIINDMIAAEKGSQWLLSAYTPFKEKSPFPGFEDQSYEEVRYEFTEALKSGTVEQFKQNFQIALQHAALRMKALTNPSADILELITSLYGNTNSKRGMFPSNNNNVGFGNSSSGLFGQSVFNQQQQQQNAASSIFAKANQTLFGGNQQNNTPSLFSGGGSGATAGSIFGGNQQQGFAQNSAIFPKQQPQTQTLFAGQNSIFTAPQNSAPFSNQTANYPFANQNPSLFANPQPSPFVNVQQQNSSIVPQQLRPPLQQQQPHLPQQQQLQQQQQPPQLQQHQSQPQQSFSFQQAYNSTSNSSNVFSNSGNTVIASNVFNIAQNQAAIIDEDFYSPVGSLTEKEIAAFDGNFDIFALPEKPPTHQMCFG